MISYKHSTYQIFIDTCNGKPYQKNVSNYEETRNMIMIIHQEQYI